MHFNKVEFLSVLLFYTGLHNANNIIVTCMQLVVYIRGRMGYGDIHGVICVVYAAHTIRAAHTIHAVHIIHAVHTIHATHIVSAVEEASIWLCCEVASSVMLAIPTH